MSFFPTAEQKFLARDHHGERLAVRLRETGQTRTGFNGGSGTLYKRHHDIGALNISAALLDLRDGNIRSCIGNFHARFVFPNRAHFAQNRKLPFRPFGLCGVFHRADHEELVSHLDALRRTLVDEHVVVVAEHDVHAGILAANDVRVARDSLRRHHSGAVDVIRVGSGRQVLGRSRCPTQAENETRKHKFAAHDDRSFERHREDCQLNRP